MDISFYLMKWPLYWSQLAKCFTLEKSAKRGSNMASWKSCAKLKHCYWFSVVFPLILKYGIVQPMAKELSVLPNGGVIP